MIITTANKSTHPIAKKIPNELWHDSYCFNSSFDEGTLKIGKKHFDEINRDDLPKNNQQALVLLMICYPNIPFSQYARLQLTLENQELFTFSACMGQLNILMDIKSQAPLEFLKMVKTDDYYAFRMACAGGHLDIAKWLKENALDEFMAMVQARKYDAFTFACAGGHLDTAKWLKENAPDEFAAMVKASNYLALRWACENGHLDTAKWLKENAPDEFTAMMEAGIYDAFSWACENGHLDTAQWLKENATDDKFTAMVIADRYRAFRKACFNGYLDIAKWLKENVPGGELIAMIKAANFHAFRSASANKHLSITQWLLQDVGCFAYAEAHVQEYSGLVNPFIENAFSALHLESEIYSTQNPSGIFNLTDPTRSQFCFFILRNLIRRNDRAYDDEIRFLLAIPAVKALVHQSVNEGPENELLRLAMSVGNREAIDLLMNIEEVRTLAEEHDYYQDEARNGVDMRQLALDRESSMTALTQGEAQRLKAAIALYQPMIKTTGIKLLLQALKDHLQSQYETQPATITIDDHQIIRLPMAYKDFLALGLKGEDEQRALKAYYQTLLIPLGAIYPSQILGCTLRLLMCM